jgi:ferritin-like metal-binding protein YciE
MIARAGNYQMEKILDQYYNETRMRIYRIEEVFYLLDQYPKSKDCHLVSEILDRMNKISMERTDKSLINSDLLLSLQSINYLVIARYASVAAYAKAMDKENVAQILNESILAAKEMDKQITSIMKKGYS